MHLLTLVFELKTKIFYVLEGNYRKLIYRHFPIINKIIDIGRRLAQIIDNSNELSAKLPISKIKRDFLKIYRYQKITYRTPLVPGGETVLQH